MYVIMSICSLFSYNLNNLLQFGIDDVCLQNAVHFESKPST